MTRAVSAMPRAVERSTVSIDITSVADLIDLDESLAVIDLDDPLPPARWAFRGQPREFATLVPAFQRQFARKSYGTAELIERRLIEAFRSHYAELNDLSPDMPTPDMLGPYYDLRCLSAMAHYEIPTRLLDWTSDFWTAVYFACASDSDRNAELWYYDRQLFENQRALDRELATLVDDSPHPRQSRRFSIGGVRT
jgi:hypothetical protein